VSTPSSTVLPAADAGAVGDVVDLPGGGRQFFYEAPLPDGSHEQRSEPALGLSR